jgi:hypothetical protein
MDQLGATAVDRRAAHLRRERDVDKPDLRGRKRRQRESTSLYVASEVWARVKSLASERSMSASEAAEELLEWALNALNEPDEKKPAKK